MGFSGTTYARSRAVFQYLKLRICSSSTTSAPFASSPSSPVSHINRTLSIHMFGLEPVAGRDISSNLLYLFATISAHQPGKSMNGPRTFLGLIFV